MSKSLVEDVVSKSAVMKRKVGEMSAMGKGKLTPREAIMLIEHTLEGKTNATVCLSEAVERLEKVEVLVFKQQRLLKFYRKYYEIANKLFGDKHLLRFHAGEIEKKIKELEEDKAEHGDEYVKFVKVTK